MGLLLKFLLGAVASPVFGTLLDSYKAKLAAGTDQDKLASDLAARELEVQQAEIQAQSQLKVAEIGHWYEPEKLFAYLIVIYFAKVIVWDKVFAWGVTDPLTGQAASLAGMVMSFYIGRRGIENVARILKR